MAADMVPVTEKPPAEATRVRRHVRAAEYVPVLKAARCLFTDVCRKEVLQNIFAKVYTEINVSDLNRFENGAEVTAEALKTAGIIKKVNDGIVVLGRGDLTAQNLTVKAARFSKSAEEKIAGAGGKAEVV